MGHNYSGTYNELSLEPMEYEGRETPLFGDFSSRDRKQKGKAARARLSNITAGNSGAANFGGEHIRKPSGKANFLIDDRRMPDRRRADRRGSVRITGDRRQCPSRRAKTDPWDKEFRA